MSGYFEKAPLVYVVAKITVTELPTLLAEQIVQLEQAMFECDLIHKAYLSTPKIVIEQSSVREQNPVNRKCYMSSSRCEALVISDETIEWRVADYKDYSSFKTRLSTVLDKLVEIMRPWHNARVREVSLSYVDVVIPISHKLSDYFSETVSLPLVSQESSLKSDFLQLGKLEWQRVVNERLKVEVSVEQLSKKVRKYIPDNLVEPSQQFAQPLSLNGNIEQCTDSHYAVLMTQTSAIPEVETKFESLTLDILDKIHTYDRSTFKSMINLPLCKEEWGYRESTV